MTKKKSNSQDEELYEIHVDRFFDVHREKAPIWPRYFSETERFMLEQQADGGLAFVLLHKAGSCGMTLCQDEALALVALLIEEIRDMGWLPWEEE